jgi:hypothetical protein
MKTILTATCCALFLLTASFGAQKPPPGFTALFNGKNLDGWWGLKTENPAKWMALSPQKLAAKKAKSIEDINKNWRIEGDDLVNDGKGLYLSTIKNYGDFEFLVEYKTVAKADSGIYLRGVPQVQIWDYTKAGGKWKLGADKGSGGLWNNNKRPGKDPLVLADKPFGEWNAFRIVMVGERVSIWLNDKHIVDHVRLENYFNRKGSLLREAPIELQTHGGQIRWRNIFTREIPTEEGNKILAKHGTDGFKSIFNGRNFNGWKGPVQNYEIDDGAIRCKKGKGGTIHTVDTYADFAVRFEFKLPPGGNNGLALRYPGSGDTAYVGMCELQVLDDSAPKYAKLDPRQYHASVYGQVAARRGYQRAVGEWNFQEVTVKGPNIKVELNGTVILDADTSKVKDFMYKAEKFKGRTRKSGHFGFAGHSSAVEFRNVSMKRLK